MHLWPNMLSTSCFRSIDSLLTSVIADNMTKTKHNSNRELIGQGIGTWLLRYLVVFQVQELQKEQ